MLRPASRRNKDGKKRHCIGDGFSGDILNVLQRAFFFFFKRSILKESANSTPVARQFLPLDEAIASRVVVVIASGSDGHKCFWSQLTITQPTERDEIDHVSM